MAIPTVVLKNDFNSIAQRHVHPRQGDIWVPVRPVSYTWKYTKFLSRLKDAWGVLTGRYDAIDWEIPE